MQDSKFYKFLKTLTGKELRKFRKYLESPYFNSHIKLLQLYELFEWRLLDENSFDLSKEEIWERIYPDQSFDYDSLRKLQHQLMNLGFEFLSQMGFEDSTAHQTHFLLQILHRKQMTEFIESTIQSGINKLNRERFRSGNFYHDLYSIEKYRYVLENMESVRGQKHNIQKLNIDEIDNQLNYFYFAEKLKYFCLRMSWSKITEMNSNVDMLTELVNRIPNSKYLNIPSIAIYYQIFLTYKEPEIPDHFFELKKLIKKHIHLFPPEDARDIMNSAINYTIQKQNQGHLEFSELNFELWKQALDSETVLINNELSPWAFKNIITLGLRLKEYDWIENFIQTYGSRIPKEYRENAINYNQASLYFYKKNYNKAIPLLQKVQFDEVNYGLGAKSLLLAMFYEQDEQETLNSLIESFKLFVKRNKNIADWRKKTYLQLIQFTKKMHENSDDIKLLAKLKVDIRNSQAVNKQWLLEKVDELLN